MKSAATLLLAWMLALEAPAAGWTARPPEQVQISGQDYVRLADWARGNGFEARWTKRDEVVELSNRAIKIVLNVDSCEAQVKGVLVWLLFPVAQRNGAVYVSRLDVRRTLEPILAPPRNPAGIRIRSICLDPGHGGKDPGNRVGRNEEKKYTLLLAEEVRRQLSQAGLKSSLTRTRDTFLDLPLRPDLARTRRADLFVSLHFNSVENSAQTVQGAEVYCLTPHGACSTNARGEGGGAGWCVGNQNNDKNLLLAFEMQKALLHNLGSEDRGVRRARFAVLRDALMPAVLIEAGFMSHPHEGHKILDPTYRRQIARAIVEGLLTYKRVVEQGA